MKMKKYTYPLLAATFATLAATAEVRGKDINALGEDLDCRQVKPILDSYGVDNTDALQGNGMGDQYVTYRRYAKFNKVTVFMPEEGMKEVNEAFAELNTKGPVGIDVKVNPDTSRMQQGNAFCIVKEGSHINNLNAAVKFAASQFLSLRKTGKFPFVHAIFRSNPTTQDGVAIDLSCNPLFKYKPSRKPPRINCIVPVRYNFNPSASPTPK